MERAAIKVYISHARAEDEFARALGRELEQLGLEVLSAASDLLSGGSFHQAVELAIGRADVLVAVFAEQDAREWQREELEIAFARPRDRKLRVLPLVIGDAVVPVRFDDTPRIRVASRRHKCARSAAHQIFEAVHSTGAPQMAPAPTHAPRSLGGGLLSIPGALLGKLADAAGSTLRRVLGGFGAQHMSPPPDEAASEEGAAGSAVSPEEVMPADDDLDVEAFAEDEPADEDEDVVEDDDDDEEEDAGGDASREPVAHGGVRDGAGAGATRSDPVRFSVFAPPTVAPGRGFVLDLWAYVAAQRGEVERRASKGGTRTEAGEVGPFNVPRDTQLEVRIEIATFGYASEPETLTWLGEPANVTFGVPVPPDAPAGACLGRALITYRDARIAKLDFELTVGEGTTAAESSDLHAREERVRSVFASYASEDRIEALQVQRALEPLEIDVFIDVLSLRAGADWERELWNEIPQRDRFYLLWSANAANSPWVDKEWRCALDKKGIDFIEPVGLADPRDVPPPRELSKLHFNSRARIAIEYERARKPGP